MKIYERALRERLALLLHNQIKQDRTYTIGGVNEDEPPCATCYQDADRILTLTTTAPREEEPGPILKLDTAPRVDVNGWTYRCGQTGIENHEHHVCVSPDHDIRGFCGHIFRESERIDGLYCPLCLRHYQTGTPLPWPSTARSVPPAALRGAAQEALSVLEVGVDPGPHHMDTLEGRAAWIDRMRPVRERLRAALRGTGEKGERHDVVGCPRCGQALHISLAT